MSAIFLLAALAAGCKKEPVGPTDDIQPESDDSSIHRGEIGEIGVESVEPLAPEKIERRESDYMAGMLPDAMFIRIFADSFSQLERKQRILAYHLVRAALAGVDITYDQLHRDGLEVRQIIECINNIGVITDPAIETKLSGYLKSLWIHNGFYHSLTSKKLVPAFAFEQLEAAAKAALAVGADLDLRKGEPLEAKLSRLKEVIFDPGHQAVLASPVPVAGQDILKNSHLNIYDRVTMRDLAGFTESYPRNSRLIRVRGKMVEEIYRVGEKRLKIPPGRYASELRRINRRLQEAMTSGNREQRRVLVNLVDHFRTGDASALPAVDSSLAQNLFEVEFFIGFTDTGIDPREIKGIYSGVVGYQDPPKTSRLLSLTRYAKYFEEAMPWNEEYRKDWGQEIGAAAVILMVSVGRMGPLCELARQIYTRESGEVVRSKVLLFSNVIAAYLQAVGKKVVYEFVPPANRATVLENLDEAFWTQVALRELLGYDMGKTDRSSRRRLKSAFAPICALKAELTGLWLLADPKLIELGLLSRREAVESLWRYFIAESVAFESMWAGETPRHPPVLARRMITRYLVEKAKSIDFEEISSRVYPVIKDLQEFRADLAVLLGRVERILATADRVAALKLLDSYSAPADWQQLSGFADRAKNVGLRRLAVCVNPKMRPRRDPSGKVNEVIVVHDESFEQQMMRYRKY